MDQLVEFAESRWASVAVIAGLFALALLMCGLALVMAEPSDISDAVLRSGDHYNGEE